MRHRRVGRILDVFPAGSFLHFPNVLADQPQVVVETGRMGIANRPHFDNDRIGFRLSRAVAPQG